MPFVRDGLILCMDIMTMRDIFDVANPSSESRKLYKDFLINTN